MRPQAAELESALRAHNVPVTTRARRLLRPGLPQHLTPRGAVRGSRPTEAGTPPNCEARRSQITRAEVYST
jgi:hypothetical protein